MDLSELKPGLPRAIDDLDEPAIVQDTFVRPWGCELVWADPGALAEDFALPARPGGGRRDDIDRWLLEQCARVSAAQTANEEANTPIRFDACDGVGYRLPFYGRAAVLPVSIPKELRLPGSRSGAYGLVDVKGCGVAGGSAPANEPKRTGLLPLRRALREVMMQGIVEGLFAAAGLRIRGVPVYGIVKLGFDVKVEPGTFEPAALLLRRAHQRPPGNIELPRFGDDIHRAQMFVELFLRHHGVSTAHFNSGLVIEPQEARAGRIQVLGEPQSVPGFRIGQLLRAITDEASVSCGFVNVQMTRHVDYASLDVELVDFGQYVAGIRRFDRPFLSAVVNLPMNFGCVFRPGDPGWIQPSQEHSVDFEQFAEVELDRPTRQHLGLPTDERIDRLNHAAACMATDIALGRLDRESVDRSVKAFVARALNAPANSHDGLPCFDRHGG